MIIALNHAFDALVNSAVVIMLDEGNEYVARPSLVSLTSNPNNEWLYLLGTDENGNTFEAKFIEENNACVEVDGTNMKLVDTDGETIVLNLLTPTSFSPKVEPQNIHMKEVTFNTADTVNVDQLTSPRLVAVLTKSLQVWVLSTDANVGYRWVCFTCSGITMQAEVIFDWRLAITSLGESGNKVYVFYDGYEMAKWIGTQRP